MPEPVTFSGGPPGGLPVASNLDGTEVVAVDQGDETAATTTLNIAKTLPNATTSAPGKMSAADKTKLDGVAEGATANATDADLRDRTTHTGTQPPSTITGLDTALSGKETAGAAAAAVAAHELAADPHTQYLTPAEGDAAYAPVGQGVTGGNSHDHSGSDGAQIAYSSLSGAPTIPSPADVAPSALAASAAIGTSTDYAREDHVHALPGTVTTSAAGLQPASSYGTIAYAAQVTLDFAALNRQINTISLTGNLELLTGNLANGREVRLRLVNDATLRTLAFPAGWKFIGTKPADIAVSKVAILSLAAFGTTNADVVAAYAMQS
jgi:hypothetical protein